MKVWMTEPEERAFRNLLAPAVNVLEFGCGGSTVVAATSITGRLVSIDSSADWLGKVRTALTEALPTASVSLRYVDIGPTKEGGYPVDTARYTDWPNYHGQVWDDESANDFDLFVVDGRFRVACFVQTVLRCRTDAVIVFHDYAPRPSYHVVERLAREIYREQALSAFVRRNDFETGAARDILLAHRYVSG